MAYAAPAASPAASTMAIATRTADSRRGSSSTKATASGTGTVLVPRRGERDLQPVGAGDEVALPKGDARVARRLPVVITLEAGGHQRARAFVGDAHEGRDLRAPRRVLGEPDHDPTVELDIRGRELHEDREALVPDARVLDGERHVGRQQRRQPPQLGREVARR